MASSVLVQARVEQAVKTEAAAVLRSMGLSVSDAVRMLLIRVAQERALPFDVRAPNAATREAITELEAGKGVRFASVEDLMTDLREDD